MYWLLVLILFLGMLTGRIEELVYSLGMLRALCLYRYGLYFDDFLCFFIF